MRLLLLASAFVGVIALASPAQAQFWNDDYNYGWPQNPNNPNFDPAAAAINSLNAMYGHRRGGYSSPIDFSLIDQMERGDYSAFKSYHARCQARYVSYDRRKGTYIGSNGMPKRCRP